MVGQQTLDLYAGVRILPPQPEFSLENLYPDLFNVAPSSSGLGHRPLKAKTRIRIPSGPPFFVLFHFHKRIG